MTTRTLLLSLHIALVAGWLGANYLQILLTPRFDKERDDVAAVWTRQAMWLGARYYMVVGILIAVTGVLLVLDGDFSWSNGFIWVGVAAIVFGAAAGSAVFTPLAKRKLAALESGDRPAAAAAQRTTMTFAFVDTAVVLLAVLAMVHKWAS